MTRVLHVIDSLAETGGAEQRLVEEVLAMRDRFEQRVVRLFERDDLQPRLEEAGIEVIALGLRGRDAGRTWPWAAWQLGRVLDRWPPDVVHTSLFTANLVGELAARWRRIPVVSSFNRTGDLVLQRALQPGAGSWKGRTMQAIARRAAQSPAIRFRAVSTYAGDSNSELYRIPRDRVTVVPRGVEIAPLSSPPSRSTLGLPQDVPLFVNVARLVPEKAQHLIVDAFAEVRRSLPDAELLIVGAAGSAEHEVRAAIVRHGLGDAVHLLGWRADVKELVAAADVFVFSSLSEGSPSAVVEAMAWGIPVVAFAIPPVVEITGGSAHARLVRVGSTTELAREMVAAYAEDDRDSSRSGSELGYALFDGRCVSPDR